MHGTSRQDRSRLGVADVRLIGDRISQTASDGRDLKRIRRELSKIDRSARFSKSARSLFQDLLARFGVATSHPIRIPGNDLPFWHRLPNPLSNYQSTPEIPDRADVVIIGAGLTGAAAAYSLRNKSGQIVVLEKGDPCGEASGRNGGNFELLPENSIGNYEGLAPGRFAYMRKRYPSVPLEIIRAVSERQASLVLGLALRNRELLKDTILSERIACDFSPRGWLHIAASEVEEQAICDEVSLAAQHGQRIEIWSRKKIRGEFGIEAPFLGRFIPGDGTYHPFKFVCGELQAALNSGVLLYARTKVNGIEFGDDGHVVATDRGNILARRVIVATNAFTRELFPELADIEPYQSQILVTDQVRDRVRGRIVTSDIGPAFFNQPREGAADGRAPLLMGGGADRPMTNPSSRRRSPVVHSKLMEIRDAFYPELSGLPPSGEWIGPMAFTPDGLPCIGFLRPGLVVVAGYNGYGGSYATIAGHLAAQMTSSDMVPEAVPEEIFSPRRLLNRDPLFLTQRDGLWRVASSMCQQLRAVNRKISDALVLGTELQEQLPHSSAVITHPPTGLISERIVVPDTLRQLGTFKNFSREELGHLMRHMRCWDLPRGTVIFTEGSPGDSCYFIVEGLVNVSTRNRETNQLLARLEAGSVFGQVSVIDGATRSATCSSATDSILLELERGPCEQLLRGGSELAIKLLAALNDGLISALRGADTRLLQIENQSLNVPLDSKATSADSASKMPLLRRRAS